MNKIINKSTAIKTIITIIGVGIVLTIFPLRLWPQTLTSTIPRTSNEVVGVVTTNRNARQYFVAEHGHMSKLRIFLASGTTGHSFYLRMYDPQGKLMFRETVLIGEVPGYHEVLVDQDLEVGETYYYVVRAKTESGYTNIGERSRLYLGTERVPMDDNPDMGPLYYYKDVVEGQSLAASYDYTVPWQNGFSWLAIAALLLATFLAVRLVDRHYRKHPARDRLIVATEAVQAVLNPLIILLVVVSLVSIFLQIHSEFFLDNAFFTGATLLLGALCWYGANHNRDGQKPIFTSAIIRENWPDYLQTVFFALTFYACCDYVNALFSAGQRIALNKQLLFFSLAVLAMMRRREIFRYANLLYLTIAGGLAYYYYDGQIKAGMDELEKNDITIITLTTWVNLLGGLVALNVLINVVSCIIKKKTKPVSYVFSGLLLLFLILMAVLRHGKEWPLILVVCFVVYYLQYGTERRGRVIFNICRGLLGQFVWMVGYSLLFRPFTSFRSIRFPLAFHTVTVTAAYLTMVVAAALLVFMAKYRKSSALKDLWKEGILLGVALSYMVLTISRTGLLTVLVVVVFALLFFTRGSGKQRTGNMLRMAGLLVMSLVLCFPPVFYLQRTIPVLVSSPRLYASEAFLQETTRGREIFSYRYRREWVGRPVDQAARFGRFVEAFGGGVLNIPHLSIDITGTKQYIDEFVVTADGTIMPKEEASAKGLGDVMTIGEKITELTEAERPEATQGAGGNNGNSGNSSNSSSTSTSNNNTSNSNSSSDDSADPEDFAEPARDYSSGRLEVFKLYLAELNMTGHEEMGVQLPDGSWTYHAHNNYIQVAHDFGIFMGLFFIVIGGMAFVRAIGYYRKNEDIYAAFPLLVIVTFAAVGMTEYVFFFSNPSGFLLLLVLAPLLYRNEKKRKYEPQETL